MKVICRWGTVLLLLLCCGCSVSKTMASVVSVTTEDVDRMVQEERSFAVVLTQPMCSSCHDFETMLSLWKKNHSGIVYVVNLDEAVDTGKQDRLLKKLFPDFYATPGVYYIRKGSVSKRFSAEDYRTCEQAFDDWLRRQEGT